MEFKYPQSATEAKALLDGGQLPFAEFTELLVPFLTEDNVDFVLGGLTADQRKSFREYVAHNLMTDDPPRGLSSSGLRVPVRQPRDAVLAVRGWFSRNPA